MGTIHPGPSDARRIADNFSPDDIGFTLDMGNMVIEGLIDYEMGIQILGPYLAHVHVKNTAWFREQDGTWKWKWHWVKCHWVNCRSCIFTFTQLFRVIKLFRLTTTAVDQCE